MNDSIFPFRASQPEHKCQDAQGNKRLRLVASEAGVATGELEMRTTHSDVTDNPNALTQALRSLVARVPSSTEPASADPNRRSRKIAYSAASKAAAISGALALPPGPFGLATIL